MALQISKRLISVEEYHIMAEVGILKPDDRVELIEGEIIKMSPIGSKHAGYVNRISNLLVDLIGRKRAVIATQNPVKLNDFSELDPVIEVLKLR